MPEQIFQYQGNRSTTANVNTARSESIWYDCPWEQIANGEVQGFAQFFDFSGFKTTADINASEAFWDKELMAYGTTTAPITALDQNGGGVTLGSSGDNGGIALRSPVPSCQIDRTVKSMWFEVMFQTSTITDTKHDIFIGLHDNTAFSTSVPITTADAIADHNLVGFFRPGSARTVAGTGGGIMNTVYKSSGVAAVNVQTDAVTLTAATWTKVGMRFRAGVDPLTELSATLSKYLLTFYANGNRLSGTKQMPASTGDFPITTRMGLAIALMNATGSSPGTSAFRWARIAQLY